MLRELAERPGLTQRRLAERLEVSLGKVNAGLRRCTAEGLVERGDDGPRVTARGLARLEACRVDNAVILAAGFGSRFAPLTYDCPKGLLPVHGKPMLERQIEQLQAVGVTNITLVVGYLKEKFDYLIDQYGVKLLFNPDYARKNSLASLYAARHLLASTYVLASDNWMEENIFHTWEAASWYSCVYMHGPTHEWCVTTDKQKRLTATQIGGANAWAMMGPAYFTAEFSRAFCAELERSTQNPEAGGWLWEHPLIYGYKKLPPIYMNAQPAEVVREFENIDELCAYDAGALATIENAAVSTIAGVFGVAPVDISQFECAKSGMTNQSFTFTVAGRRYMYRQPGPGTAFLINRHQEKTVYDTVAPLGVTDEVLYFSADSGVKITRFHAGARNTNAGNEADVADSLAVLRLLHRSGLQVPHSFNLAAEIARYHTLCAELQAVHYSDYAATYEKMAELLAAQQGRAVPEVLCHVDFNPDNLIRLPNGSLRLIDWEYAGMADPLTDVAMYAIYAYYTKEQADRMLEAYLERPPRLEEWRRFYSLAALGGFLWALWTEYKQALGVEFGEYGMKMYRYAKDYYRYYKALAEG